MENRMPGMSVAVIERLLSIDHLMVYILVERSSRMKLSEQVKPISYLKAHAPEIIRTLKDNPQPVVITLHGEAKAILQDVGQYEETQETLALLKVLALTTRQIEDGKLRPAGEAFAGIRKRLSAD